MAWKAYLMGARETEKGAEVDVEFRDIAADGTTIENSLRKTYVFPQADTLNRTTLRMRVAPDLAELRSKENAVAAINMNVGIDIEAV